MRETLSILVLLALSAVLAHHHVAEQIYYPVVKLGAPGEMTVNVVQDAVPDRHECGNANGRLLGPLRDGCRQCTVLYARCERELKDIELALLLNDSVPYHRVVARGLRMTVAGPAQAVRGLCESIAANVVHNGLQTAACIFPGMGGRPREPLARRL